MRANIWHRYNYIWASVGTLILGVILVLLDQTQGSGGLWEGLFREENVDQYFCEASRRNFLLRQWMDSLSNLAYFWVAITFLLHSGLSLPKNNQTSFRVWKFAFAAVALILFVGSSFFHASLSRLGERWDLIGVYGMALLPLLFNLWLLLRKPPLKRVILSGLAVWCLFSFLAFDLSSYLSVGLITLCTMASAGLLYRSKLPSRPFSWVWASGLFILGGATFFFFDIQRMLCDPLGWFQPHAVWHALAAASVFCYFRFVAGTLSAE